MDKEPIRPLNVEDFFGSALERTPNDEWEHFLEKEGLELLAAYRAIEDEKIRLALLNLVKLVSREALIKG